MTQEDKKKRNADHQLTKDEYEKDDDADDQPESEPTAAAFPRASDETLATRRIVKVKRPSSNNNSNSSTAAMQKNPFASLVTTTTTTTPTPTTSSSSTSNTNKPGVFGAGFAAGLGFVASTSSSSGFGALATTSNSGSTFFGATIPPTTSTDTVAWANNTNNNNNNKTATTVLPKDVTVSNGEEGEECLLEVRCKSFELVRVEERPKEGEQEALETLLHKKKEEETETRPESNENDTEQGTTNENNNGNYTTPHDAQRWREMGVGPLRVLLHNTTSKARLVQRRETAQGGMGTKVILNLALGPETHITIRSEGSLQLVTPSNTKALLFVLKAKPIHIQKLHTLLQTLIPNSSLTVKSNDDNHDDNKEDKNKEDNNKKDNNKKDNNKTAENTPQDTTTLE